MGRLIFISLMFASVFAAKAAVVIDRIAVIAGKHVIKVSDIDRDLRLTEFLNRQVLDLSAPAKKKATDRLIDQAIIRDEIATGGYDRATDADAEKMLADLRHDRYAGSEQRMRQALAQYGLTEDELREQLLWQLTVLKFIDERFRPAVLVTDEDVKKYYDQHLAELKREYPQNSGFAALEPKIRDTLTGERINQQFESWLDDTRKNEHIEYRQGAFG